MGDDSTITQKRPNFWISIYILITLILAVVLIIVAEVTSPAEAMSRYLEVIEPVHVFTALMVLGFLVFALAVLVIWLWREQNLVFHELHITKHSLYLAETNLSFLNTILREDILNELTQLNTDLGPVGQNPESEKMRPTVNRIRRQIKFTKEYQDIGANRPEWQNVSDTITRAKVGVDLGTVTVDLDIRDVEIYADRLLEKAFFYLIDNSLRHGGPKLSKIRFYGKKSEHSFVIVCQDDGVGIPSSKNNLLFPKDSTKSGGYGLFLIKEILAITGINIRETGIPGTGARLEIQVPQGRYRQINNGRM